MELLDGVHVRSLEDVRWTEKVGMLLERVLVPTRKVAAPLYAYDKNVACESDQRTILAGYDGVAAILVDFDTENSMPVALYRPTVEAAVDSALRLEWCDGSAAEGAPPIWYFATEYPLGGIEERGRFLSRDIEEVDEQIREFVAYQQQAEEVENSQSVPSGPGTPDSD